EAADLVAAAPADLAADGVLCVLGVHRLGALEEAVRAARPGDRVTAAVTTDAPGELLPLARLAVADLTGCLRRAVPAAALPRLQVVGDPQGAIAAAAGVADPGDGTEAAVRIAAGRITARATGRLACHAAAAAAGTDGPGGRRAEEGATRWSSASRPKGSARTPWSGWWPPGWRCRPTPRAPGPTCACWPRSGRGPRASCTSWAGARWWSTGRRTPPACSTWSRRFRRSARGP